MGGGSTLVYSVMAEPAFAISSAVNLSTRMVVPNGDNVLIAVYCYGAGKRESPCARSGHRFQLPGR